MNSAVMFSKASDEWATPRDFFERIRAEFDLMVDAAAVRSNALCPAYFGPDNPSNPDGLTADWRQYGGVSRIWCNPPYSRCREFVAKAAAERRRGVLSVLLLPARTDTRWFHESLWQSGAAGYIGPRPGIEIRFIQGRLKFGDGKNSAPFPSMVAVFRP